MGRRNIVWTDEKMATTKEKKKKTQKINDKR